MAYVNGGNSGRVTEKAGLTVYPGASGRSAALWTAVAGLARLTSAATSARSPRIEEQERVRRHKRETATPAEHEKYGLTEELAIRRVEC